MPIAKVTQGKDAYLCLNYVLTKDQAELLETNCATEQPAMLAREFELAFQPHLRKGPHWHTRNHVAHFSIGFHASQSRETLIAVAHRFMDLMGFDPVLNQYVLAQHHDTDDCHLHLVENRIRLDGTVVSDSFQKKRAEMAMRTLEAEFGFPPLQCSWEVDIKAPTVSEVRRSRQTGEPIPRQAMQAIIERTVSGCRTLEALQTALQAEEVTLILTPILPDAVPHKHSRGKGKGKGSKRDKETLTEVLETGNETDNETGDWSSANVHPGSEAPCDQPLKASKTDRDQQPNPLPATETSPQTQPLNRYQLVYQWTPPNGKVQTFSASALGKRYTQRGLQENWGVGLQGSSLVEWAVQQSLKALFDNQLETDGMQAAVCFPPLGSNVPTVKTARTVQTMPASQLKQQPQEREPSPGSSTTPTAPEQETAATTGETADKALAASQQAARQYYQAAWLQLEHEYIQATGQTQTTDPHFEAQVLGRALNRWSLEQCVAMLATTPNGQAHAQQGRAAFIAYVQGVFDQQEACKRQQRNNQSGPER